MFEALFALGGMALVVDAWGPRGRTLLPWRARWGVGTAGIGTFLLAMSMDAGPAWEDALLLFGILSVVVGGMTAWIDWQLRARDPAPDFPRR